MVSSGWYISISLFVISVLFISVEIKSYTFDGAKIEK